MNILYDATPLLMRSAGVKNYHYNLLRHLIPEISPHLLRLFPYLNTLKPNRNQASNYPRGQTLVRLGGVLASNYLGLPLADWACRESDLFHVTPHLWKMPRGVCLTSMIHDPTPALLPECHTGSNIRYFHNFMREVAPRLRRIMVPSEAVRKDLSVYFGLPPEKMRAIPHGVDEDFFETTSAALYLVRQKYNLPEDYILFVGAFEPRKNVLRLVRAFLKLPAELRRRHPLVLAGASGWKNTEILRAVEAAPGVHLAGYVRRGLLPALYHSAKLFVLPSLYEGFGLPLLEAMAARLPVVTSTSSAMPEVTGDHAVLADPHSTEELTAAMQKLLEDQETAAKMGEAGRVHARRFTWERTALATKMFFEEALAAAEP